MTDLHNSVLEIIQDRGSDEEQKTFMEDVMEHGCISGAVGELVYYNQTVSFYNEHKEDINKLLYELIEETGMSVEELFGDKWDREDPLALDTFNQNLLAWFGFEEITRKIYEEKYEMC